MTTSRANHFLAAFSNLRFLAGFAAAGWAFAWARLVYFQTGFPLAVGAGTLAAFLAGWAAGGFLSRLRFLSLSSAWGAAGIAALLPWIFCFFAGSGALRAGFRAAGGSAGWALLWTALLLLPSCAAAGALFRKMFESGAPWKNAFFLRGVLAWSFLAAFLGGNASGWLFALTAAAALAAALTMFRPSRVPASDGGAEEETLPLPRREGIAAAALLAAYAFAAHRFLAVPMEGAALTAPAMLGAFAFWALLAGRLGETGAKLSILAFGVWGGLLAVVLGGLFEMAGAWMPVVGGSVSAWFYALVLASPAAFLWAGVRRSASLSAPLWALCAGGGALASYALTAWASHALHFFLVAAAGLALGLVFQARPVEMGRARTAAVAALALLLGWQALYWLSFKPERFLRSPLVLDAAPGLHVHDGETVWRGEHPFAFGGDGARENLLFAGSSYEAVVPHTERGKILAGVVAALHHPEARSVLSAAEDAYTQLGAVSRFFPLERVDAAARSGALRAALEERSRRRLALLEGGAAHAPAGEHVHGGDGLLADALLPVTRFRAAAGRFALPASSAARYDLVFQRPAGPWEEAETAHTLEALSQLKKSLAPGAIVVVPLDSRYLDMERLGRVLRTYAERFRYLQVWTFDPRYLHLFASDEAMSFTADALFSLFQPGSPPEAALRSLGAADPDRLLLGYLGDETLLNLAPPFHDAAPLRDGNGALASLAPRAWRGEGSTGAEMLLPYGPARLFVRQMGMLVQTGEVVFPPPIPVILRPAAGWQLRFTGYEFRPAKNSASRLPPLFYAEIAEGSSAERSLAVWHEIPEGEAEPLELLARRAARGLEVTHGQGAVGEHPLRWVLSREGANACFAWAWFCREQKMFFAGRMTEPLAEGAEPDWDALRKTVLEQVSCFHANAPSLLIREPR